MNKIGDGSELRSLWHDDIAEKFTAGIERELAYYYSKQNEYGSSERAAVSLIQSQTGYSSFASQISALKVE